MRRKISLTIVGALYSGQNVGVGNTTVTNGKVYLHGNLIAEKRGKNLMVTNAGWSSNVTKERLNAILPASHRITQKNFQWYMNGKRWDGGEVVIENVFPN